MGKGGPARGGKGHITGPCLDTNVSSMTTCTWTPNGESAQENQEEMDKGERNGHNWRTQRNSERRSVELNILFRDEV